MEKLLTDEKVLEYYGWEVECESPYEIRNNDGSFATGQATYCVIRQLHEDYYEERKENFDFMIRLAGRTMDELVDGFEEIRNLSIEEQKEIFKDGVIMEKSRFLEEQLNKLQETIKTLKNETT